MVRRPNGSQFGWCQGRKGIEGEVIRTDGGGKGVGVSLWCMVVKRGSG